MIEVAEAAGAELGSWRRRALNAEAELLRALNAPPAVPAASAPASAELEAEVTELRRRLANARELVDLLRTRLRFLEERSEGAA